MIISALHPVKMQRRHTGRRRRALPGDVAAFRKYR